MKDLIKVAQKLESLGLTKEASALGAIIKKIATEFDPSVLNVMHPRRTNFKPSRLKNKEEYLSSPLEQEAMRAKLANPDLVSDKNPNNLDPWSYMDLEEAMRYIDLLEEHLTHWNPSDARKLKAQFGRLA